MRTAPSCLAIVVVFVAVLASIASTPSAPPPPPGRPPLPPPVPVEGEAEGEGEEGEGEPVGTCLVRLASVNGADVPVGVAPAIGTHDDVRLAVESTDGTPITVAEWTLQSHPATSFAVLTSPFELETGLSSAEIAGPDVPGAYVVSVEATMPDRPLAVCAARMEVHERLGVVMTWDDPAVQLSLHLDRVDNQLVVAEVHSDTTDTIDRSATTKAVDVVAEVFAGTGTPTAFMSVTVDGIERVAVTGVVVEGTPWVPVQVRVLDGVLCVENLDDGDATDDCP